MPAPKPLTRAEKQRIRDLHAEGLSRNAIAKDLGRSAGAVSAFCQNEGLTFPSSVKAQFVEAAEMSVRERAAAAHAKQLTVVHILLDDFIDGSRNREWKTKLKGAGGSEHEATLDFIPSTDKRDEMSAIKSATAALKDLAPTENPADEAAMSVLEQLIREMGIKPEAPDASA